MLRYQSRYYIDIKRGHYSREPKSKRIYFWCKGLHTTSICKRDKESSRQQTNNSKRNDSKKSNKNKDRKGDNEQTQQPNTSRKGNNTVTSNEIVVLMQTATVVLNGKRNNYNRVKFRLFFDSGSQHRYISRTSVDAIKAETIRTEYLAVGTFGASVRECLPRVVSQYYSIR